jgi:hypothetical protein
MRSKKSLHHEITKQDFGLNIRFFRRFRIKAFNCVDVFITYLHVASEQFGHFDVSAYLHEFIQIFIFSLGVPLDCICHNGDV